MYIQLESKLYAKCYTLYYNRYYEQGTLYLGDQFINMIEASVVVEKSCIPVLEGPLSEVPLSLHQKVRPHLNHNFLSFALKTLQHYKG